MSFTTGCQGAEETEETGGEEFKPYRLESYSYCAPAFSGATVSQDVEKLTSEYSLQPKLSLQ